MFLQIFFPDTILGICYVFPVIHIIPLFYSHTISLWTKKIRLLGQKIILKDFFLLCSRSFSTNRWRSGYWWQRRDHQLCLAPNWGKLPCSLSQGWATGRGSRHGTDRSQLVKSTLFNVASKRNVEVCIFSFTQEHMN
jgi:hypothetical protein